MIPYGDEGYSLFKMIPLGEKRDISFSWRKRRIFTVHDYSPCGKEGYSLFKMIPQGKKKDIPSSR
jgi:hypothetical protein